MNLSDIDPWDVARKHYEREMHMFMARLMHHFGVQQIELPNYAMFADRGVTVMQEVPERDSRIYRIKGYFELEDAGTGSAPAGGE